MLFATLALGALSLSSVLALPENHLDKRFTQLCGQWDTENEGGIYLLENNLWGMSGYTGSQCSQATSQSGTTVAWKTTYTWSGGPYQVKSYSNLDLQVGLKKQISSITSIPSKWQWTYTSASSDLVADVSYDLWLSTSSTGTGASSTSSYEIMIWLSTRGGAGPAGSQIGTATVNGISWKLFKGPVSTWTVFSYVPSTELTNFNQDLLPFITYLTTNQGISSSQYLVQLQAGTEPFIGSATLTTTSYSVVVNSGTSTTTKTSTTTTKTSTGTTKTTTTTASGAQASHYAQCGGSGWTGPTTCVSPYVCTYSNEWYSQCL
ncbi:hypothetical protein FRC01_014868 [Tulasnella sp. 417]|nr:hypothetical protein FRC01_014868 [Tulasnella sp. 417]